MIVSVTLLQCYKGRLERQGEFRNVVPGRTAARQQAVLSAPQGSTWHRQCSPSPSASRAGRLEGEAARGMGSLARLASRGLWRTKGCTQWGAVLTLVGTRVWNITSWYSGMSAASPHTYLLRWGGLALMQSERTEASCRHSSHTSRTAGSLF